MYVCFRVSACIKLSVCVCVKHLNRCKTSNRSFKSAGGSGPLMSPLPTKLLMSWEDIGTDHPDVPATGFVEWEEAQPKNLHVEFFRFSEFHVMYGFRNLQFYSRHLTPISFRSTVSVLSQN